MADATPATPDAKTEAKPEAKPDSKAEAPKADSKDAPPAAPAATADAGADAKAKAAEKAAAAAAAAKNAAKAGLQAFQKLGTGAAGKLKSAIVSIVSLPLLLFRGDLNTRMLMLAFLASIGLVGVASYHLYKKLAPSVGKPHEVAAGKGMNTFFEREKELAIATANMVFLDRFSATLKNSVEGKPPGVVEFELFVENENPEVSIVVKAHLEQVRELVANTIQAEDYQALMSPEGKDAFKKRLIEAINEGLKKWTKKGTVKQVFFTRFVMG